MIVFTSNGYQSGKSVLAANLAFELAKTKRVCLVDADLVNPSQHIYFGLNTAPASLTALTRLIQQARLVDGEFEKLTVDLVVPQATVTLVAGVPSADAYQLLDQASFEALVEFLCLKFDEVIFDLSTIGQSPNRIETYLLERANQVNLVCLADQISIHRFINSLEVLSQYIDFSEAKVWFNQVRSSVLGSSPEEQLLDTLQRHSPFSKATFIPYDQVFDTAMHKSVPIRFASKKSQALKALESLAN